MQEVSAGHLACQRRLWLPSRVWEPCALRLRQGQARKCSLHVPPQALGADAAVFHGPKFGWKSGDIARPGRQAVCHAKKKNPAPSSEDLEPWAGAIVFSPLVNQTSYTFTTTLERLGLADLSNAASGAEAKAWLLSELASARSSSSDAESLEDGTPVLVQMGVSRSGKDLIAQGRVDTVFALQCTRCLAATTYKVEAPFQLLLSATPVVEPTLRSLGVVIGEDRWGHEDLHETFLDGMDGAGSNTGLLDLDLDDKVYFPATQASVDLSKYFRDTVHLELPLKVLCGNTCKGMCFNCGANLNLQKCTCEADDAEPSGGGDLFGPGKGKGSLAQQLREQLKRKEKGWA